MKYLSASAALLVVLGLCACSGPRGPQGAPGSNGVNGTNGAAAPATTVVVPSH